MLFYSILLIVVIDKIMILIAEKIVLPNNKISPVKFRDVRSCFHVILLSPELSYLNHILISIFSQLEKVELPFPINGNSTLGKRKLKRNVNKTGKRKNIKQKNKRSR